VLRARDFADCRKLFDILLVKNWSDGTTFTNVLHLAREYHRLSFTLENVAHAFLILMVVFEALFKKEKEKASKAAKRIGRLLGATKKACKDIQREFNNDFCKARNKIAHGDSSLPLTTVANLYPCLYRHVTRAIILLLHLPAGTLDPTKDYYDEINRYVNGRFGNLPAV
jgi:hypothetical protein